jgi:predicted Zn-ribbon and HTH transcriptional regulator
MPTLREKMIILLEENPLDARALSSILSLREKEVYPHLEHVRRSLKTRGKHLSITPYQCRLCGFEFKSRGKLTPPGRCPQCKQGSIEPAVFAVR